jgi:hypothetical protein
MKKKIIIHIIHLNLEISNIYYINIYIEIVRVEVIVMLGEMIEVMIIVKIKNTSLFLKSKVI